MKKLFTLFGILLLFLFLGEAQVPLKFNYQAAIRNSNHQLVANSAVTVRVLIIPQEMSNVPVYQEEHHTSTNENGLMTLQVGGGQVVQGIFSNIQWEDGPYYLQVDIDPDGGENFTISSVQQLMSVPYALYADKAGNGGNYEELTAQIGQLWAVVTAQQDMIDSLSTIVQALKDSIFPDPVYDTIPIQDVTASIPCWLPSYDTVVLINDQDSLQALCPNAPTLNLSDSTLIMISGYHATGVQFVICSLTSSDHQQYQLNVQIMPTPTTSPTPWRTYCLIPKISSLSQVVIHQTYLH